MTEDSQFYSLKRRVNYRPALRKILPLLYIKENMAFVRNPVCIIANETVCRMVREKNAESLARNTTHNIHRHSRTHTYTHSYAHEINREITENTRRLTAHF